MTDQSAANIGALISREQAGNRIGSALRLYVGRGRRYSVKQLSNATGVKDRVIECAMTDAGMVDYRPLPPEALLSIALFLGADFTNEWLSLARQGAFDLPDDGDPNPGDLALGSSEDTTEIVRMAADNTFANDDPRKLREVGSRKIKRGMQLVAAAEKAA